MNIPADDLEYVGFWPRVAAMLLDTIFQLILIWLIVALFLGGSLTHSFSVTVDGLPGFLLNTVLPVMLAIGCWLIWGATPGKLLMRAKIVDAATGEKPSTGQFIIRYLSYFISAIVFCLGFLWIAFDARKQGWHDKLAGTVVVRKINRHQKTVRFDF